ncbi:hypothetical protein FJN17_16970 [Bradyrhizobium symbiodeficiens]|uniref:Uncharacterized protein n=1 Tax=Bradyrhizobium symbiodeficiens TaxID=1404367 RepID=A0ABX5W7X4_9BRAD|nr:hypothetical protein [Bradyrhizobium symbiodeficiens]QDF39106.1 hypothetical protein FJN17_16970 [Bradyrhizobium symbiodeficiens]
MPIFDIQTHLQFYEMLVDDFDDLMRERHSARRAFHCIMEAYHLREWVWHDLVENNQKLKDALNITSENDFNSLINRRCIWFPYFRAITNGSKHFETRETGFDAFKVEAAPFSLDVLDAGFGEGVWHGPVRYVSGSLPVGQDGEGAREQPRFVPVLHVIEAVVRFWRDTLRTFNPDASVKSSAHHNEQP